MKKKTKVALFFGGRSAEHEVSIRSARTVFQALDRKKYEIIPVAITKKGIFISPRQSLVVLQEDSWPKEKLIENVAFAGGKSQLIFGNKTENFDVAFPVLHGPYGEDGAIQGLFKTINVPFVGPGVLGSAAGMDKDMTKRLLRDAQVPIGNFLAIEKNDKGRISFEYAKKKLGLPLFIKPANLGSSVGVFKVGSKREFLEAAEKAFLFDNKVLVEEFIKGREMECAVLGEDKLEASAVGEIRPAHEFYSYEAKYLDDNGAVSVIPAKISKSTEKKIRELSIRTCEILCCSGLSRVDFFLKDNGEILVNEINTLPGFTSVSMYPKLWEYSGVKISKLVDILIKNAIIRFEKENKLKVSI